MFTFAYVRPRLDFSFSVRVSLQISFFQEMAASLDPAGCSINPEGVPKSPSDPVEERSEGCKKSNAIVRREEDDLEQEKKRRSIFNRKKSSKTNEPLKRKELLSLAVASRRLPQEEEFYIQVRRLNATLSGRGQQCWRKLICICGDRRNTL